MDSSDVGALCVVPTKDVIQIFFDFTQLPPDLIYTICGYYNDWLEYEELVDLKDRLIQTAHDVGNKWHYTYNSYYNQKFIVQALQEYMLNMECKQTLQSLCYKNKKDMPGSFFNYRLHLDIAKTCQNIVYKNYQYWNRNEVSSKGKKDTIKPYNILQKYSYRRRIKKIMLKDLDIVLVFKSVFDAVYERAVALKIQDKKTSPEGRVMWEQELRLCERAWNLPAGKLCARQWNLPADSLTGTDLKNKI